MIQAVDTPAQRERFCAAIAGQPYFHALLGRDLALWGQNPGAPTKLFVLPRAALAVSGSSAQLCGTPQDWGETAEFLRFVGVERLTCPDLEQTGLTGLPVRRALYLYTLAAGGQLPQPPLPQGYYTDREPPIGEIADLIFPTEPARRDAFYSESCSALAHGLAQARVIRRQSDGGAVSTVGSYAIWQGEAYLAMGETVPELRGQGIGGAAISALANELSAAGNRVTLLCERQRRRFYERLGFAQTGTLIQYEIKKEP